MVETEAETVARAIEAADAPGMSARDSLLAGAKAYLDAMALPGRVRILLVDGPAILGREAMRDIEGRHADASLREGLRAALAGGTPHSAPIEQLASLLSAMFERAALDASEGSRSEDLLAAINAILVGLVKQDKPGTRR